MDLRRADLEVRITRARLLIQLAGEDRDSPLADVLTFARQIGVESTADTKAAFRAEMQSGLEAATTALAKLRN